MDTDYNRWLTAQTLSNLRGGKGFRQKHLEKLGERAFGQAERKRRQDSRRDR